MTQFNSLLEQAQRLWCRFPVGRKRKCEGWVVSPTMLQSLSVGGSAASVPQSDATSEGTLNSAPVEGAHGWGGQTEEKSSDMHTPRTLVLLPHYTSVPWMVSGGCCEGLLLKLTTISLVFTHTEEEIVVFTPLDHTTGRRLML